MGGGRLDRSSCSQGRARFSFVRPVQALAPQYCSLGRLWLCGSRPTGVMWCGCCWGVDAARRCGETAALSAVCLEWVRDCIQMSARTDCLCAVPSICRSVRRALAAFYRCFNSMSPLLLLMLLRLQNHSSPTRKSEALCRWRHTHPSRRATGPLWLSAFLCASLDRRGNAFYLSVLCLSVTL